MNHNTNRQILKEPIAFDPLLENYLKKGARKGELYRYYKPRSENEIKAEIWEVLIENRNINISIAKNVKTIRASEVRLLHSRVA